MITIQFQSEPLAAPPVSPAEETGAVVEFWGLVRAGEGGQRIGGLVYEIYAPMAEKTLRAILNELRIRHPFDSAVVLHRYGVVRVGEASIYLRVASKHRAEAFQVSQELMNRLKMEVPIWKVGTVPC